MSRRAVVLPALASVLALVLAGCSATHSRPRETSQQTTSRPSVSITSSAPQPLTGKFSATPIAFATAQVGLVMINGFAGSSGEASSWQERTTDGGVTWVADPVTHAQGGASTQIGLSFVSASEGWAYQPNLLFTTDGGATWQPEPKGPAGVDALATYGMSTWINEYPCRPLNCLYETTGVGGRLTLLTNQLARSDNFGTVLRPSENTAWVLTANSRSRDQLLTTVDGGHSWRTEPTPCAAGVGNSMSIYGGSQTGLYLMCVGASQGMCSECGARELYRSTDNGATWTRETSQAGQGYGPITPTNFIEPVGSATLWAIHAPDAGPSAVLRSSNSGRTWSAVKFGDNIQSFVALDAQHAWFVTETMSQAGAISFDVHRTTDAGRTWQTSALPIPAGLS